MTAGCFWCTEIYPAKEAVLIYFKGELSNTLGCPKCEIPAVTGDRSGLPINKSVLTGLRDFWYKKDEGWAFLASKIYGAEMRVIRKNDIDKKDVNKWTWFLMASIVPNNAKINLSVKQQVAMDNFFNDLASGLACA
jgi:hypothetical protein